jgi:hypothetical protein
VAGVAFLVGVVVGAMHVPEERQEAEDFARAWQRGNHSAMYRLLSESSRRRISEGSFAQALQDARDTATAKSLRVGDAEGKAARVVSVPCLDRFAEQDADYRDSVLPPACRARVAVEAASPLGWHRWVGENGDVIAMEGFGASAPARALYEHFGFSGEQIARRARAVLERTRA